MSCLIETIKKPPLKFAPVDVAKYSLSCAIMEHLTTKFYKAKELRCIFWFMQDIYLNELVLCFVLLYA